MQQVRQKWFNFPAILLAAVLVRAFAPAGSMPAAPGKGLLFELCHDGPPTSFVSALEGHAHHGDVGANHGPAGDCSFGHILTGAYVDSPDAPEVPVVTADGPSPVIVAGLHRAERVYAREPRGHPSRKQ